MIRLFVALRPPPAVRKTLLGSMDGVVGARWQNDGQLHVTLRFIGEVDERTAEDIDTALTGISARPFAISLSGVGMFDHPGRPTALWAGVTPVEPIAALHRKVDGALVSAGLPPDRRAYRPHATVGRLNASSGPIDRWLVEHTILRSEPWTADAFQLYRSDIGRDGASYEAIARYRLRD